MAVTGLTPVITEFWDDPALYTLDGYRSHGGYQALAKALKTDPDAIIARHGAGHRLPPSAVNYRANIDVLKRAGVTDLYSLSAVGSLHGDLPPGTFVLVDQFIDRTFAREKSFFGPGCVGHVAFSHPVSPVLQDIAEAALKAAGSPVESLYYRTEGHGFHRPEHQREYYSRLLAFLSRSLGGGIAAAATSPNKSKAP